MVEDSGVVGAPTFSLTATPKLRDVPFLQLIPSTHSTFLWYDEDLIFHLSGIHTQVYSKPTFPNLLFSQIHLNFECLNITALSFLHQQKQQQQHNNLKL